MFQFVTMQDFFLCEGLMSGISGFDFSSALLAESDSSWQFSSEVGKD